MSLAFLPEGRMEEGVREMEAEAAESEDERVIEFAAYVRTQWLERVGASVVQSTVSRGAPTMEWKAFIGGFLVASNLTLTYCTF